jgi:prepilin-type N-terminal cleavage/methylation domain-containing protein
MKNNKGFSLVEMMVAAAVMAVLIGAFAMFSYQQQQQQKNAQIRQAMNNIANNIDLSIRNPQVIRQSSEKMVPESISIMQASALELSQQQTD